MTEEIRTDNANVIANTCKKIADLEKQIEKMKCCANCWKYYRGETADDKGYLCEHHEFNDKCELWELEE